MMCQQCSGRGFALREINSYCSLSLLLLVEDEEEKTFWKVDCETGKVKLGGSFGSSCESHSGDQSLPQGKASSTPMGMQRRPRLASKQRTTLQTEALRTDSLLGQNCRRAYQAPDGRNRSEVSWMPTLLNVWRMFLARGDNPICTPDDDDNPLCHPPPPPPPLPPAPVQPASEESAQDHEQGNPAEGRGSVCSAAASQAAVT